MTLKIELEELKKKIDELNKLKGIIQDIVNLQKDFNSRLIKLEEKK